MSELVLKALMQLFAILVKQDGGMQENELEYVRNFLLQQLGDNGAQQYLDLFHEISGDIQYRDGNQNNNLHKSRIYSLAKGSTIRFRRT